MELQLVTKQQGKHRGYKKLNLMGMRFGHWIVIGKKRETRRGVSRVYWLCRCDCGNEKYVLGDTLKTGESKSCGCKSIYFRTEKTRTHGLSKTKEYNIWEQIKRRCYKPKEKHFKYYGGRGIIMCDRWLNSFENFLTDMGKRPTNKHSIDRIDNNGNYEPSNCRWALRIQQANNTRANVMIEYGGETDTMCNWARRVGIDREILRNRIQRLGWSVEKTFNTPVGMRGGYKGRTGNKIPLRDGSGKFTQWVNKVKIAN
jgi:hypothetical protein